MWQFFHLLSTSQYSSRSNHSGHSCCCTNMNHLQHHLLCASDRYWYRWFHHHINLYQFPSPRHLSSSDSYALDLSWWGVPTGSNATADLTLRVTGTLHHSKVVILPGGTKLYNNVSQNYGYNHNRNWMCQTNNLQTIWIHINTTRPITLVHPAVSTWLHEKLPQCPPPPPPKRVVIQSDSETVQSPTRTSSVTQP
jgi:hypothetical protein